MKESQSTLVFFFQIPKYSQKVHKQFKQECKLIWGHFCYVNKY